MYNMYVDDDRADVGLSFDYAVGFKRRVFRVKKLPAFSRWWCPVVQQSLS